jgi:hypothetical protein
MIGLLIVPPRRRVLHPAISARWRQRRVAWAVQLRQLGIPRTYKDAMTFARYWSRTIGEADR